METNMNIQWITDEKVPEPKLLEQNEMVLKVPQQYHKFYLRKSHQF
jgi:hypothetical protein